jgi:beta-phosphoglucomutase-like phosphatase (HAD superfamily)
MDDLAQWTIFLDLRGTIDEIPAVELNDFLKTLHGNFALAIVSSGSEQSVAWFFNNAGIEDRYQPPCRSSTWGKSNQAAWIELSDPTSAKTCIVVDDDRSYIKAAQAAGLKTILFSSYLKDFCGGDFVFTVDHGLASEAIFRGNSATLAELLERIRTNTLEQMPENSRVSKSEYEDWIAEKKVELSSILATPQIHAKRRRGKDPA